MFHLLQLTSIYREILGDIVRYSYYLLPLCLAKASPGPPGLAVYVRLGKFEY